MAEGDDNCVTQNFLGGYDVMLNGFMFCMHSKEHCHRCAVDHRPCNNIQIEDDLTEDEYNALTDYGAKDLADRPSLDMSGQWQKIKGDKTKCKEHNTIGCKECFNWKEKIMQMAGSF